MKKEVDEDKMDINEDADDDGSGSPPSELSEDEGKAGREELLKEEPLQTLQEDVAAEEKGSGEASTNSYLSPSHFRPFGSPQKAFLKKIAPEDDKQDDTRTLHGRPTRSFHRSRSSADWRPRSLYDRRRTFHKSKGKLLQVGI